MIKERIFEVLLSKIEKEYENAEGLRELAQDEANDHIGAMQSRYDTFKEEAQYLAAAYTKQKVHFQEWIRELNQFKIQNPDALIQCSTKVRLGTIVKVVDENSETSTMFLVPVGGGEYIYLNGIDYQIMTHHSPLGKAIIGKNMGDIVFLNIGSEERKFFIVYVE